MAQNFWKTVDLKDMEIPKDVLDKRSSVLINEGIEEADGVKVFYREAQPISEKSTSGVSLVMLHGKMFSSKTWLDLGTINTVAAMGYRVLAIDIPGYGNSPSTIISDRATFLKTILETFEVTRPVIVSPSLSGFFTLPFLLRHHEMLAGYVPVAPVGIEVLNSLPESKDDSVVDHVYEPLREFLKKPLPDLRHIKTPTMVVFGEKDRSLSSALLSLLPNSQSQEIPNGRHPAYLDDPDLWHKLLYNFLRHVSEQNA